MVGLLSERRSARSRLPFSVRASRVRHLVVPRTLFESDVKLVAYLYLWM
jgi:hypothetical protein